MYNACTAGKRYVLHIDVFIIRFSCLLLLSCLYAVVSFETPTCKRRATVRAQRAHAAQQLLYHGMFASLLPHTYFMRMQVLRPGLVKGPWTQEEDDKIRDCITAGIVKWSEIASRIPGRIGKQCRERWYVYSTHATCFNGDEHPLAWHCGQWREVPHTYD